VQDFDDIFTELTQKGHKPTFNVNDNQATTPIKNYLKKANCRWQFVEPSTIESTPLKDRFRRSKITSLVDYARPTRNGRSNFGINLPYKP
jgi:hypothetical protein